jgi:hypothetical protein
VAVSGAIAGALTGSSSSALAAGPQRPAALLADAAPGGSGARDAERDSAVGRASRGARSYLPLNGDPIAAAPVATAAPVAPATPAPLPEPGVAPLPPPVDLLANGFERVPGCDAEVATDVANGLLEDVQLCPIGGGHQLRPDAAAAYLALDAAFQAQFGVPLEITDSYRSLAAQRTLARQKPSLAARPGTSEHGWGLAVDLFGGVESYRSAEHRWLREHAPAFGWDNPPWARDGGSREEPWHWEYDPAFVRTA